MKILLITDTLASGGKERRISELMKMLALNQEIEFELVVMNTDIHYKEVLNLNINIHFIIRKSKKDISVFYKLYKICKNCKPDIVHCWDSMTAIYAVPICRLLHIKLVNSIVNDSPINQNVLNKHWLRAKLTFPFSDLIIGNSKSGLKAYNAPVKRSIVIYNGFNFERINNIIPPKIVREKLGIQTRYVIGMVATFSDYKDYKTYYNAAQLLLNKRNDLTFLAIGNKTDSVLSKGLIRNTADQYFRLLGEITDVESCINIMDICILSTFTEGISNSILEYMAMGKPVIATSGGGTNEIIVEEETGLLVNASDPILLAEKMEMLLNDEKLRREMGENGKGRIGEIFSIDRMTNAYIEAYHSILIKK